MAKITDKDKAIKIYEKAMGYKNGIPEFDEGIYEVLFDLSRKKGLTEKEIRDIAGKYENEEYETIDFINLTDEEKENIFKRAQKKDEENIKARRIADLSKDLTMN